MSKNAAMLLKFCEKADVEAFYTVNYNTIDNLINEFFDCPPRNGYQCVCENEWNNDSKHSFNINGKLQSGNLEKYDLEYLEAAKQHKWNRTNLRVMLNHMCAEGALPAGNILIEVDW